MKQAFPSVLITFAFVCFALVQNAQAVSPPPDGGYPGANTAEGTNALFSLTTGVWNTALGYQSLYHLTTGNQNTATGYQALLNTTTGGLSVATGSQTLFSNTTGSLNTATGFRALYSNTTGSANTGNGFSALVFNTTGTENTAEGSRALYNNTTGSSNTATGAQALFSNTTGGGNTADGDGALYSNTGGRDNTATGSGALSANTNGSFNTANGFSALNANTGSHNTAMGSDALGINRTGESNTATGDGALSENLDGSNNTANGFNALGHDPRSGSECGGCNNNTAVGANALLSVFGNIQNNTAVGAGTLELAIGGHNNIAIGYLAGANLGGGDYNIDIGNPGEAVGDGNTTRIGDVQTRAFIAGIYATTTGSSTTLPVIVDSNGQLGTAVSSERFKKDIKPMQEASESILALKPVSFHYKSDNTNAPQFGLVAEEVASVNPDLVVRDKDGKPYTVRYEAVNAMLLNEFLKEHRKVEELQATVTQLIGHLKEQDSKIQKISNDLEISRRGTGVVANR